MSLRPLTSALTNPRTARAAARALAAQSTDAARIALADLLWEGGDGIAQGTAAKALCGDPHPLAREVLADALTHPRAGVRRHAAAGCPLGPELLERLRWEPAWTVRAAIGRRLLSLPPQATTIALSDPHWRARFAAIESIPLDHARSCAADDPVSRGAVAYLAALPDGPLPQALPETPSPPVSWWDPDPIVTRRALRQLSRRDRKAAVPHLPAVLSLEDAMLRRLAIEALLEWAAPDVLATAVSGDPRAPHQQDVAAALGERLEVDRIAAVCAVLPETPGAIRWAITHHPSPAPGWLAGLLRHPDAVIARAALRRLGRIGPRVRLFEALTEPRLVATALDALAGRVDASELPDLTAHPVPRVRRAWARCVLPLHSEALSRDPDARVRALVAPTRPSLADDPDHRVRAAAMTPSRAAALLQHPDTEPSWRVLRAAAACLGRPLPRTEPPVFPVTAPLPTVGLPPADPLRRPLGSTGLQVSPLGLTGHYGLDERGFAMGHERGVSLMFWEPAYAAQARFVRSLPPQQRSELVILTGSYDAEPRRIRRDLERALRTLKLDRVAMFFIWWVRSWRRISPAVRDTLLLAQEQGLIETFGLSTHQRGLAVTAIEQGWPVVMTRHNAAHRGAAEAVFPAAQAQGCGLITFSNLCYGRMLQPGVSAADCYRYSLSFDGVSATLSAPSTLDQLQQTLTVLDELSLPADRRANLERVGATLHHRQRAFARGVRWR